MKNKSPVDLFVDFYRDFKLDDLSAFEKVYDSEVSFEDPFHKVLGAENLYIYFKKMMTRISDCQFEIGDVVSSDGDVNSAFVCWRMRFTHSMLDGGKEIIVDGATHIKYRDKIVYHKDYFDTSQLLYRHIPILGRIVKSIEKRM